MNRLIFWHFTMVMYTLLGHSHIAICIVSDATYCYSWSMVDQSVCLCVCLSVCWTHWWAEPCKMTELMKVLFRVWTQMGPRNHVLDGGTDPSKERTGQPEATITVVVCLFFTFIFWCRCIWVWVTFGMAVISRLAVRQWTMHCWGMARRITSFVQQSAACVRIFRMVQMLSANMNRCVLHLLIPESVNCWRLVYLDSFYPSLYLRTKSVTCMMVHWPVFDCVIHVVAVLEFINIPCCKSQGSHGSWKVLNLEFSKFRTWKVLKLDNGPEKVMKKCWIWLVPSWKTQVDEWVILELYNFPS